MKETKSKNMQWHVSRRQLTLGLQVRLRGLMHLQELAMLFQKILEQFGPCVEAQLKRGRKKVMSANKGHAGRAI